MHTLTHAFLLTALDTHTDTCFPLTAVDTHTLTHATPVPSVPSVPRPQAEAALLADSTSTANLAFRVGLTTAVGAQTGAAMQASAVTVISVRVEDHGGHHWDSDLSSDMSDDVDISDLRDAMPHDGSDGESDAMLRDSDSNGASWRIMRDDSNSDGESDAPPPACIADCAALQPLLEAMDVGSDDVSREMLSAACAAFRTTEGQSCLSACPRRLLDELWWVEEYVCDGGSDGWNDSDDSDDSDINRWRQWGSSDSDRFRWNRMMRDSDSDGGSDGWSDASDSNRWRSMRYSDSDSNRADASSSLDREARRAHRALLAHDDCEMAVTVTIDVAVAQAATPTRRRRSLLHNGASASGAVFAVLGSRARRGRALLQAEEAAPLNNLMGDLSVALQSPQGLDESLAVAAQATGADLPGSSTGVDVPLRQQTSASVDTAAATRAATEAAVANAQQASVRATRTLAAMASALQVGKHVIGVECLSYAVYDSTLLPVKCNVAEGPLHSGLQSRSSLCLALSLLTKLGRVGPGRAERRAARSLGRRLPKLTETILYCPITLLQLFGHRHRRSQRSTSARQFQVRKTAVGIRGEILTGEPNRRLRGMCGVAWEFGLNFLQVGGSRAAAWGTARLEEWLHGLQTEATAVEALSSTAGEIAEKMDQLAQVRIPPSGCDAVPCRCSFSWWCSASMLYLQIRRRPCDPVSRRPTPPSPHKARICSCSVFLARRAPPPPPWVTHPNPPTPNPPTATGAGGQCAHVGIRGGGDARRGAVHTDGGQLALHGRSHLVRAPAGGHRASTAAGARELRVRQPAGDRRASVLSEPTAVGGRGGGRGAVATQLPAALPQRAAVASAAVSCRGGAAGGGAGGHRERALDTNAQAAQGWRRVWRGCWRGLGHVGGVAERRGRGGRCHRATEGAGVRRAVPERGPRRQLGASLEIPRRPLPQRSLAAHRRRAAHDSNRRGGLFLSFTPINSPTSLRTYMRRASAAPSLP